MSNFHKLEELIFRFATATQDPRVLVDDLPLGSGGLGLDSVSILELLFECEKHFGIAPASLLAQHKIITIGTLRAAVAEGKAD